MKVAIVIERIEHWRGGAETSTQQLIHHLAGRGCEVHLITASRVPSSPDMTVHTLPVPRPTRRAQTVQFLRQAEAELGPRRFDIVHSMAPIINCDVYQPRGGTVAESVQRNLALVRSELLRRIKRLANRFNTKQQSLLRQESRLLRRRRGPVVAALSQYVVDQLRHHYHVDGSRIRLVFNGVDVPEVSQGQRHGDRQKLREQLGLTPQDLVLLMVAHNFKLKGVARGIEAVERLKRSGGPMVKALIVGRDNPRRYRRLAERLAIANQIMFVGPTERVLAFYHAADILVHPTYYDPCSRVVLEALASGLPAITTRHNGAAEVIEDGAQGYVIDSADAVDQLADRIRRLADSNHRRACGEQGRRLRGRLSMARHADEMLAVYQEILRGPGANP
jgi:UDP-glucose:(heptosyl)LPS alpha-1,3-glucosyltransferase